MKYTTVLFDFHGVFTSNRGRTVHALVQAMNEVGISDRTKQRDLLIGTLNRDRELTNREYLLAKTANENLDKAFASQNEQTYVPQYSWMIPVLANMGAKIGVVSNGRLEAILPPLKNWGILPFLEGVYARGENGNLNGSSKKPSGEPIKIALEDFSKKGVNVEDGKILYIGDHAVDVGAARNAKIDCGQILSGPEQISTIKNHPNFYLCLHHLKNHGTKYYYKGIPVHSMRDLPSIVAGEKITINSESLCRGGLERR